MRGRYPREVYRALRMLADLGEVQRLCDPDTATVCWTATRPPRFVDELAACYALTAPDDEGRASAD